MPLDGLFNEKFASKILKTCFMRGQLGVQMAGYRSGKRAKNLHICG
jgi:hypothetical protein